MAHLKTGLLLLAGLLSLSDAQSDWVEPWITGPPENSPAYGYVTLDAESTRAEISELIRIDRNATLIIHFSGTTLPAFDDSTSGYFDIAPGTTNGTGHVILKRNLDYENTGAVLGALTFYFLSDVDVKLRSVTINVKNENDNIPLFNPFVSNMEFDERKTGTIQKFAAHDNDEGDSSKLVYKLEVLSGNASYFQLETVTENNMNVANLNVIVPLDYERETFYLMKITVSDRAYGTGPNSSIQVALRVKDVGDEPPRWKVQRPLVRIPEEKPVGFEVLTVLAEDGDIGVGNPIIYSLEDGQGYFAIDSRTGRVTLTNKIDRDTLSNNFDLLIIATEENDPSSTSNTTSSIFIDDINDCPPVFSARSYSVTVAENYVGRLPLEDISVFDPDLNIGSSQGGSYRTEFIGDPSIIGNLTMVPENGTGRQNTTYFISVKDGLLDYENRKIFSFQLKTTESENPAHTDTVDVTIEITDVNDNTPYFENMPQGGYRVDIAENAKKNDFVLQVVGKDNDVTPEYGTPSIVYSLLQPDGVNLAINPTTGEITVLMDGGFDREKLANLIYTVQITDRNGSGSRNLANLAVTVTDINDTPPRFQTQNLPSVLDMSENTAAGDVLIPEIVAQDSDLNPSFNFAINWNKTVFTKDRLPVQPTAQNHLREYFAIEKVSVRAVSATAKLIVGSFPADREVADAAEVYITVEDTNTVPTYGSTDEVRISITIMDVNDNDPVFTNRTWNMEILENAAEESLVGSVLAKDVDADNIITYSISQCSEGDGLVDVDGSTGRVTVKQLIDRETTPFVRCTLTATDSGTPAKSSTSTLEVRIRDVNDCDPKIVAQPANPVIIPENSADGFFIGKVQATDQDEGTYGQVKYLFSQFNTEGGDHFAVDLETGEIRVKLQNNQTLDFEQKSRFAFKVEARDNYNPAQVSGSRSSFVDIVVELTDVNDNAPQLPRTDIDTCVGSVPESNGEGSTVYVFIATDRDEANKPNSQITYLLEKMQAVPGTPSTSDSLFRVDTEDNKGILRVNLTNLSNRYGNYTVTIKAQDHGNPPMSTTQSYKICVTDSNDNSPVFQFPAVENLQVDVYENNSVNSPLMYITNNGLKPLVIRATDSDQADNGKVSYSFIGAPEDMFNLDRYGGNFILLKEFDRLQTYKYTLTLTAQDAGTPEPRSTTRTLTIFVRSSSQHKPEFPAELSGSQLLTFSENKLSSADFSNATDLDNINTAPDAQEQICYFVVGGSKNYKDYFDIPDPKRNSLELIKELDRESSMDRDLWVVVEASNACTDRPPGFDELTPSHLNISLIIIDENDRPPYFSRNYSGGISPGDKKDRSVFTFQAEDPDLNDTLTYSLSNFQASDVSIQGFDIPFTIKESSRELILNFDVQNNMKGFFQFSMKAKDKANHEVATSVKVYIISQEYKVTFLFENPVGKVQENRNSIADIFSEVYQLICNVEKIEEKTGTVRASNLTTVYSHFVDPQTDLPVLSTEIENKKNDVELNKELIRRFGLIGLDLTEVRSAVDPADTQQQLFMILFIIVCVALLALVALIFILVVRGNQMNRKIKALSATTFGSQDSGLNRLGAAVPNTNKHTLEGSNPMWNVESPTKQQDGDNISESSGDSILIGVEDNPEFTNYNGGSRFGQQRANPYEQTTRRNPLAEGTENRGFQPEVGEYIDMNPAKKRPAPPPPAFDSGDENSGSDGYEQVDSNFTFGGSNLSSL